jgi:acetolactate synthase I/II/III large subunit
VKRTGGQIVVRALEDEEVPFAFGIPGTHNIELYDALAASTKVRPVLVTDEQSASFMADAVWRSSGRLACANVVPGAGLTHAMSGIAEAFLDNVALLVLGCGIRRDTGKAYQLHDVDQLAMVRPVTKAQFRPQAGEELYATIREACRVAREPPAGPVFVEVPANLYLFTHDVDLAAPSHPTPHTLHPAAPRSPGPDTSRIQRAADLLNASTHPLLYLGLGAAGAGEQLVALAERLEAPVATTFQGKGVFPESHPLALWPGFGDAAPPFARAVADGCDATLAIGCRFGEVATGSYGFAVPRPLVHVDVDPQVPGKNYPADVAIAGDAAAVVPALLAALAAHPADPALRARIAAGHAALARERSAAPDTGRVSPARLLAALQQTFGPRTIFTADSGNGTFLAVELLRLDAPGRLLAPVDYSCMGYAVPAAIGAKLARPDCPVVALAGDGAFLMTGLELLTAGQQGAAAAVFVLRDGELAQIAQFQETALNRKTASAVADYDLGAIGRGLRVESLELKRDADIAPVLERVAAITGAGRPVLVDTAIDYSEKTFFTRGVVKTTFLRLPWRDRLRYVGRALVRRVGLG